MRHSKKHSRRRKALSRGAQQSQQLESRLLLTSVLGDFDGDGHNDLATGIPHEDVGRVADAGTVLVRYGTGYGLWGRTETWNGRNIDGLSVATDDQFGASLTVGDFDGNGVDDLAIGVPNRDVSGIRDAGAVAVVYGYRRGMFGAGLSPYRTQTFYQGVDGLADKPEMLDRFGTTLAAGDFTGDGNDELVVGVPGESFVVANESIQPSFVTVEDAGALHVIRGGAAGLTTVRNQYWHQVIPENYADSGTTTRGTLRLPAEVIERYDRYGSSLAVGNFDGVGNADLAIGIPGESIGSVASAGAVQVLYSRGEGGLGSVNNDLFYEACTDRSHPDFYGGRSGGVSEPFALTDTAEAFDQLGFSLAAGDFNRDGTDDLAVGVPGEMDSSGAVQIIVSAHTTRVHGLGIRGNIRIRETDLEHSADRNDLFGYALATGALTARSDQLVIGIPGDAGREWRFNDRDYPGPFHEQVGSVAVIDAFGSRIGGRKLRNPTTRADSYSVDYFGSSITIGQINSETDRRTNDFRPNKDDLIIGAPGDDVRGVSNTGSIHILTGMARIDQIGRARIALSQGDLAGVSAEAGDEFGGSIPQQLRRTYQSEDGVPHLESNPGATHTIYLDFNGTNVRSSDLTFRRRIKKPVFSLEGSRVPANRDFTINAIEAAVIEDIWATVAEDFAAFDVNVTTHEPTASRFTRVVIGGSSHATGSSVADRVYRSYNRANLAHPGKKFVSMDDHLPMSGERDLAVHIGNQVSQQLGIEFDLERKIEEGITLAHPRTLGMFVDTRGLCDCTVPDSPPDLGLIGTNWRNDREQPSTGEDDWGAIMGALGRDSRRQIWTQANLSLENRNFFCGVRHEFHGYYKLFDRTTDGSDELSELTDLLGPRADDHGDSVDAATLMTSSIAVGNIETANDTDVFILDVSPGGTFSVDVDVAEVAPNLDLELSVFELSESGDVRARQTRIEPIDRLGASSSLLTLTPIADRIVVMVSSRGEFAGDIGTYTVRTTFMPAPPLRRWTRTIATPVPGTSFAPLVSRSMSYMAMPAASDQGLRSTSSFTQKVTPAFSLPQADPKPVSLGVDNLTKPKPQQSYVTAMGTQEPDMLQGLAIEKAFVDFEVQLAALFNKV
jgi:hypothetical protein